MVLPGHYKHKSSKWRAALSFNKAYIASVTCILQVQREPEWKWCNLFHCWTNKAPPHYRPGEGGMDIVRPREGYPRCQIWAKLSNGLQLLHFRYPIFASIWSSIYIKRVLFLLQQRSRFLKRLSIHLTHKIYLQGPLQHGRNRLRLSVMQLNKRGCNDWLID